MKPKTWDFHGVYMIQWFLCIANVGTLWPALSASPPVSPRCISHITPKLKMAIYPWKFRSPLWPLQLMSQDSQLWPKLEFRLVRISVKHLEILGRKNWDISFEKIRLNLGNHHDQSWSNQQLVRSPGESGDGISHFLTMIWPPNKLKLNHSVQFFFFVFFPSKKVFPCDLAPKLSHEPNSY